MHTSMCYQIWTLIRRYCIYIRRFPIRSALRVLLWPGFVIGVSLYVVQNKDPAIDDLRLAQVFFIPGIAWITTIFHVYHFCDWFVRDKSIGFKSLMLSMGLSRPSYHLANIACMLATILPITLIVAIISCTYILTDVQVSVVLLLFVLLAFQLTASILALVSLISSSSYVSIIYLLVVLDSMMQGLLPYIIKSVSSEVLRSALVFLFCISPYQPLRIFASSYLMNKSGTSRPDYLVAQPTYLILMASAFWSVVLLTFSRWFEEVCPWQNDSAVRGPCFCFQAKNEFESLQEGDEESADVSNKYIEKRQHNLTVGIRVDHVTKCFSGVPAVNNLSFNIYKGETTLLLGHNGAGKSTLMNVVLKKLQPDSGKVYVKKQEGAGRPPFGVCPQESILDEYLTVQQHLELFVDIKSCMIGFERTNHIRQTLDDISLTSQAFKVPNELSGGMKRKLSLGMAFVGKSEVLILDEPSSGLDPDSRSFIWNAIRRYRSDRTVLLSTQHMEEADYLGDRVAIMNSGRIVCCGSSVFLNNLFGHGYKLRIECHSAKRKQIVENVKKYFKDVKLTEADGSSYQTRDTQHDTLINFIMELKSKDKSQDSETQIIALLEDIETNSGSLGIVSFGLRSSSIEDVMLSTSKYFSQDIDKSKSSTQATSTRGHIGALTDCLRVPSQPSGISFLRALAVKNFLTFVADWLMFISYRIIVPLGGAYSILDSSVFTSAEYSPLFSAVLLVIHLVYYPVLERTSKFKIMQLTSKANFLVYWLAQLLLDSTSIIINVLLVDLMFHFVFKYQILKSSMYLYAVLSFGTAAFTLAGILFAYVLSHVLNDARTANGWHLLIYAASSIAKLAFFILEQVFPNAGLSTVSKYLTYLFAVIIPGDSYIFLLSGFPGDCLTSDTGNCIAATGPSRLVLGFVFLIGQTIMYSLILYLVESRNLDLGPYCNPLSFLSCFCKSDPAYTRIGEQREIDRDVVAETTKAMSLIRNVPTNSYSQVSAALTRSYKRGVKVVENLSLTVNKGECFGLLGVNGAGKSTTFSMLTTEAKPDSGTLWCNGVYSHHDLSLYRQMLGYDPQSNPELSLSPYQALYLMARLRSVNEHSIHMLVGSVLELLEMSQHAHKRANQLSGGTKRKLALGMALVGNPSLLVLDEPTAGVDPLARRGVWQLLKALQTQNQASIIISSHAMEECEAICDRITIMSRGRLRCIGTFLQLRNKFLQGTTLKVQFGSKAAAAAAKVTGSTGSIRTQSSLNGSNSHSPSGSGRRSPSSDTSRSEQIVAELHQRLAAVSAGPTLVKLADRNVNSATFNVTDNRVKRSTLFKIMRDLRREHPHLSYMINDSSLEDIFITLAREQQEQEGQQPSGGYVAGL